MSRSIHTTEKDLRREYYFSKSDGVASVPGYTKLELASMQKSLHKINKQRHRQAAQKQAPNHVQLTLGCHKQDPDTIIDTLVRNRTRNPNRFIA